MIKVLVVDDSALVRKLFGRVLTETQEFEVAFARDGVEALAALDTIAPDVITLDINMPQMNGLQCLDRIMVQRPCPVVMVSSLTEEGAEATLDALRLGAVDFVAKPSGAVSLGIEEFAPTFVDKIRSAAGVKISKSRRLRERVQFKTAAIQAPRRERIEVDRIEVDRPESKVDRMIGDGLVVVGTSTGGPSALEALLTALPSDFPFPIVVAQHMPAGFTAPLAKRLNSICEIEVVEVSHTALLRAGCAYIGRGDADLVVSRRSDGLVAKSVPAITSYPWHPSTDRLVRTAMQHVDAKQIIGVLMTGMGDDGAAAMTELREKGGKTIAEAEETAIVWGMPGELVLAGGATWVVALPKIANHLLKLVPNDATHS